MSKVRQVRIALEFIREYPADWNMEMIEFFQHGTSACADNFMDDLEKLKTDNGCLCYVAVPKFIRFESEPYDEGEQPIKKAQDVAGEPEYELYFYSDHNVQELARKLNPSLGTGYISIDDAIKELESFGMFKRTIEVDG